MFDCSGRKILIGVVTGTLLSTAGFSVLAANDENTHILLDSQGKPVRTVRPDECVQTPRTPNTPPQFFEVCGAVSDRDGDGIYDDEDVCPDNTPEEISKGVYQSGPRKGCSIDTDKDGVPDYRSDCPNNTPLEISKGVDDRGCPLDSDQDGVPDYRDDCPGTPFGAAVNERGCKLIDDVKHQVILAGDVTFAFDKAILTSQAKMTLNELINQIGIDFIKGIEVVGYTDSVGSEKYNRNLSDKRAMAVANYLRQQGLQSNSITQWGAGESNPIAPNNTRIGRAKNRRVELSITRFKKR
jgi:OOP family OmpA-OmpF porin